VERIYYSAFCIKRGIEPSIIITVTNTQKILFYILPSRFILYVDEITGSGFQCSGSTTNYSAFVRDGRKYRVEWDSTSAISRLRENLGLI
jgi:hypothetical protein